MEYPPSLAAPTLEEFDGYRDFAATTIQRYFRGYVHRKTLQQQKLSAVRIQRTFRYTRSVQLTKDIAAGMIQRAWRAFSNLRIYRYYRDLIRFRERGEPRELLRCLAPREAELADAAAGLHVRFRLGGSSFPPLIYFKVFTHRSVTDINAFCPRDYANEVAVPATELHNHAKPPQPVSVEEAAPMYLTWEELEEEDESWAEFREYLKPDGTYGYRSTQGWYRRVENNGWRPIAERVLADEDGVLHQRKRIPVVHYSPTVRREDAKLKQKIKKREWMLKVYREGMRAEGREEADILDDDDLLDVLEGETDAGLLAWTDALDFDHYMEGWAELACSAASEAYVPEPEAPYLDAHPIPPVASLNTAYKWAGVQDSFTSGPSASMGSTSGVHIAG